MSEEDRAHCRVPDTLIREVRRRQRRRRRRRQQQRRRADRVIVRGGRISGAVAAVAASVSLLSLYGGGCALGRCRFLLFVSAASTATVVPLEKEREEEDGEEEAAEANPLAESGGRKTTTVSAAEMARPIVAAADIDDDAAGAYSSSSSSFSPGEEEKKSMDPIVGVGGVEEYRTASGERCHWGTSGCHAVDPILAAAGGPGAGLDGGKAERAAAGAGAGAGVAQTKPGVGAFVPKTKAATATVKATATATVGNDPRGKKSGGTSAGSNATAHKKMLTKEALEGVVISATAKGGEMGGSSESLSKSPELFETSELRRPPEGFVLSAHVVYDPLDGLSYFVDVGSGGTERRKHKEEQEEGEDGNGGEYSDADIDRDRDYDDDIVGIDLIVPFMECGAVGSATERFLVKSGSFRHFPSGSDPNSWSVAGGDAGVADGTSGGGGGGDHAVITDVVATTPGEHRFSTPDSSPSGPHRRYHQHGNPQLVVALRPLEITVSGNNGETREFDAGDVILLGDTLGKGHKMRAARGNAGVGGMSVLVLNLPHNHHHHHHHYRRRGGRSRPRAEQRRGVGEGEHLSVLGLNDHRPRSSERADPAAPSSSSSLSSSSIRGRSHVVGRADPCMLEHDPAYSTLGVKPPPERMGNGTAASVPFPPILSALGLSSPRRIVLTAVGVGASSFLTYFVYRVAPPVLGLMGVLGLAAAGAAALDGIAGFVLEEWAAWAELRRAQMEAEVRGGGREAYYQKNAKEGGGSDSVESFASR